MIYTNIRILESNAANNSLSHMKRILWVRWARNLKKWISLCMYFCCCSIDSWKEVKLVDGPQRQRHTTFFANPYQNLLKAHSTTKTACLDFDIPISILAHIIHLCANFTGMNEFKLNTGGYFLDLKIIDVLEKKYFKNTFLHF